jgi:hypothetical protein
MSIRFGLETWCDINCDILGPPKIIILIDSDEEEEEVREEDAADAEAVPSSAVRSLTPTTFVDHASKCDSLIE